ncbi:MAG: hypothetical protein ACOX8R_01345 [Bacillota bacterium]|jgi:hypothetical protein
MSTLHSFGRKAGHAADRILKKSSDMLEVGKVKLTVTREEHKIDEACYRIGAKIFELYKDSDDAPNDIAADIAEIKERKARIDYLTTKVNVEAEEETDDFGEEVIIDITEDVPDEEKAEAEEKKDGAESE